MICCCPTCSARLARIERLLVELLTEPRQPAVVVREDDGDAAVLVQRLRQWVIDRGHQVIVDTIDDAAVAELVGRSIQTIRNRRSEGREIVPSRVYLGRRRTALADIADAHLAGVVALKFDNR